jgi:ferrous iron transport protein B
MAKVTLSLAGHPNSGKSNIFNHLTGARQHVGNYPGVTVEKKEGLCIHGEVEIQVVDLPGTCSLTASSIDEIVARNYLLEEKPDVVVNIADASNLERNLYLTTQLRELGGPMVLALNMSDIARARGIEIDRQVLSEALRDRLKEHYTPLQPSASCCFA